MKSLPRNILMRVVLVALLFALLVAPTFGWMEERTLEAEAEEPALSMPALPVHDQEEAQAVVIEEVQKVREERMAQLQLRRQLRSSATDRGDPCATAVQLRRGGAD